MFDVICFGDPTTDFVYQLSESYTTGGKMLGQFIGEFQGGTTSNASCALANLGVKSAVIGRIPIGDLGKRTIASFKKFGVDVSLLTTHDSPLGTHCIISIEPNGEKSLIYCPTGGAFASQAQITNALSQCKYVYIMAADFEVIADHLVPETAIICVDFDAATNVSPTSFNAISKKSDIIFINDVGYKTLFKSEPSEKATCDLLEKYRLKIVIITGGSGISYMAYKSSGGEITSLNMAAFKVSTIDTTGAGDVFNATFIACHCNGMPVRKCFETAMAAGALAVEKIGARGMMPNYSQITNFIDRANQNEL